MLKKIITALTILCSSVIFSQGVLDGYFKGKGTLDLAVSGFNQSSNNFFTNTGGLTIPRSLTSFGVFGQYGITSKLDVVVNVPFINFQFQDISLAAKYELMKTELFGKQLSVIPALVFATPISNYSTNTTEAIGQRATVISPRLIVQQSLFGSLFFQIQTGYNLAVTPVVSSFPLSMKIGGSHKKLYADFWFDHQTGFGGLDYPVSGDLFRELGVSYNRVGGVFYYGLKNNFGAFFNYSYTLSGRNTPQALGVGTGVVLKFSKT